MQRLNRSSYPESKSYPERVLQFGEGNFLRGFVDWQIQVLNEKGEFNGSAVVIQPRGFDKIEKLNRQDGLYTLYLQGMKEGRPVNEFQVIDSISRGINLFTDYNEYLKLAASEELRFIVSNTTEAGVAFQPEDRLYDRPQKSFPAKLTSFLYYRFKAFSGDVNRGCIIIPCELIENNGKVLKELVLKYAKLWNLNDEFIQWIHQANTFYSSLVDRIVPGYPSDTIEEKTKELGFIDELMVVGEQYHLWVIEGPQSLYDELPVKDTGLNTIVVDDLTPYRTRKVRILNGAHTAMTPVAYLSHLETVEDAVNDPEVGVFLIEMITEEIIPTLEGEEKELSLYAEEVLSRFANPYIKHYLMSISLNSISKFHTRNIPTLLDYMNHQHELPKRMVFSLSTLIYFYRGKRGMENIDLHDQSETLQFFYEVWKRYEEKIVTLHQLTEEVLCNDQLWGRNLAVFPNLAQVVANHLLQIEENGVLNTLRVLNEKVCK